MIAALNLKNSASHHAFYIFDVRVTVEQVIIHNSSILDKNRWRLQCAFTTALML